MKTLVLSLFFSFFLVTIQAQQISVISPAGTTVLFNDLNTAISSAEAGSTIYIPGGGFQISDETKITKKLTIIGAGYRADTENTDGGTMISGNIRFEKGSDYSTLMGIHLSSDVIIGLQDRPISNILIRYCNISSLKVHGAENINIHVNQSYVRASVNGGGSPLILTNNISSKIVSVLGGVIDHNVLLGVVGDSWGSVNDTKVTNNLYLSGGDWYGYRNIENNNISSNPNAGSIIISDWSEVIVGPNNGVSPTSNFALKGAIGKGAATDGTDIGIYGGTGFKDSGIPPVPRIISKIIPEQTDEDGNLNIQIHVKAN